MPPPRSGMQSGTDGTSRLRGKSQGGTILIPGGAPGPPSILPTPTQSPLKAALTAGTNPLPKHYPSTYGRKKL